MSAPRGISEDIIRLGKAGKTPKEISVILKCGMSNIYRILDRNEIDYKRSHRPLTAEERDLIVRMRRAKKPYREIVNATGRAKELIKRVCLESGVQIENVGNQYERAGFDRIENAKRYIEERTEGFEYAGSYTGIDGYTDIKCLKCETVFRISFVSVRHGAVVCSECARRAREERRIRKEAEKERAREEKARAKAEEKEAKRIRKEKEREHLCPVCGAITTRKKYCSSECSKRASNRNHEAKRRLKIKAGMIDKDITLEALYTRDEGVCYICGEACIWEDYTTRDGQKQCGNLYPSIDHMIPLAKGGEHSWANVRLAHRRCNALKRDTVL